MPRKSLIRSSHFPYHVTNQVNNRDHYSLDLPSTWNLFTDCLYETSIIHGARIHALVLMPNHYHLIVTCPESDLGSVMGDFGTEFTKRFNLRSGRCGHVFRGRYHWSLIDSALYAAHAIRYVYLNPVRVGLIERTRISEYSFSTLPCLLGLQRPALKLDPLDSLHLPHEPQLLFDWLQEPTRAEDLEVMRMGLRRARFNPGMERSSAKRRRLLEEETPSPLTHRNGAFA